MDNKTEIFVEGTNESRNDNKLEKGRNGKPADDASSVNGHETQAPIPTWRLSIIIFCLTVSLLLSALETSIVATALVTISSSLGNYAQANWVVVSYMLTYTSFLIIYARLSDIFGRKPAILCALAIFGSFSLGCGLAQTMEQLIVLRAFQGMGASGLYSMVFAVAPEIIPLRLFGVFSGAIGAVYASASLIGPTVGGAIVEHADWRWVYLLNVPVAAFLFVLLFFVFPGIKPRPAVGGSHTTFKTIDWLGIIFALSASVLTVYALQSVGTLYTWQSGMIIGTLTVGLCSFIVFITWEILLPHLRLPFANKSIIPIFPVRLMKQRIVAAAMLTAFFSGFPFLTTLILLPQRLQITNALSPLNAGLRLLALLLTSGLGSGLGGAFGQKPFYTWIAATCANAIMVIGMGLMSTLDTGIEVETKTYAFMVILGFGFGMGLSSLIILSRIRVKPQDSAVVMAIITQVRILGGVIALAIASSLTSQYLTSHLEKDLTQGEIAGILGAVAEGIGALSEGKQEIVRRVFGEAWALQQRVMLGVSGAAVLATLGMYSRTGKSFAEVKHELEEWERGGRQAA